MSVNNYLIKYRIRLSQLFMILTGTVILFSENAWESSLVSDVLYFIGAILVGIATVGRLWCSVYISGYKVNTLITTGPYSLCWNPLYFFSLLGSVGVGFGTETFIIPLIVAAGFAIQYPLVISKEEVRLSTVHKDAFNTYRGRVPKFIPSFSSYEETDDYMIKPKMFRKRLFDSLWFIWIMGILEFMEALHEYSILPIFFRLY